MHLVCFRTAAMHSMFFKCENFNQPLNNWNVSNVKFMNEMFYECKNFNQSLDLWIVSPETDIDSMFKGATSFDINNAPWYELKKLIQSIQML